MAEKRGGVVPGGEALRGALKWLSERRQADPQAPRGQLIDEAAQRFDLTPLDVDFLLGSWKE
jgi:hypothetical protein